MDHRERLLSLLGVTPEDDGLVVVAESLQVVVSLPAVRNDVAVQLDALGDECLQGLLAPVWQRLQTEPPGVDLTAVASGLALVFGIMDVVNFAHGDLVMLGGFTGAVTIAATGNFRLALLVAVLVIAVFGAALQATTLPIGTTNASSHQDATSC